MEEDQTDPVPTVVSMEVVDQTGEDLVVPFPTENGNDDPMAVSMVMDHRMEVVLKEN